MFVIVGIILSLIETKEALKDIVPIKWSKAVLSGNKKAIVRSVKSN